MNDNCMAELYTLCSMNVSTVVWLCRALNHFWQFYVAQELCSLSMIEWNVEAHHAVTFCSRAFNDSAFKINDWNWTGQCFDRQRISQVLKWEIWPLLLTLLRLIFSGDCILAGIIDEFYELTLWIRVIQVFLVTYKAAWNNCVVALFSFFFLGFSCHNIDSSLSKKT